ncbi:unnamed protein product, partial [Rotaria sp. Silwood1]
MTEGMPINVNMPATSTIRRTTITSRLARVEAILDDRRIKRVS